MLRVGMRALWLVANATLKRDVLVLCALLMSTCQPVVEEVVVHEQGFRHRPPLERAEEYRTRGNEKFAQVCFVAQCRRTCDHRHS